MKHSEFSANEALATRARHASALAVSPAFSKRYNRPAPTVSTGFVSRMLALSRYLRAASA